MTKSLPIPSGRQYSRQEIAAARRQGLAHTERRLGPGLELIEELGGVIVWAGGPYYPKELRRRLAKAHKDIEDLELLIEAVDREWAALEAQQETE